MTGRLWIDGGTAADGGVPARIAAELGLPRTGEDGRPRAGDAVLVMRREGRDDAAAERKASPGIWFVDGSPGLRPEDAEQLRLAGISLGPELSGDEAGAGAAAGRDWRRGTTRLFEVPVFHLEPLAVRRIGRGAGVLPSDWEGPHPLRRRLAAAAVKALYAAGRDFGVVRMEAADDGAVRIAEPFGEPADDDYPLWVDAIRRFRGEWFDGGGERDGRTGGGLLIGADPEFLLVAADGRVVSASRYFPRGGAAGSDALRVRGQLRCPVAELRPDPAADPDGLIRNIRRLMRRAESMTEGGRPLRWLAGGMPVPGIALGGHLHLNVRPNARLLRVLDSCIALPLAAAEDSRAAKRRPRYGALGDFRRKAHGFEYRTPPSWLAAPLAARAAFAIALLAAQTYPALAALTGLPSETPAGRRAYYAGDRDVLRRLAGQVHASMRRVPEYRRYERWIAPFFTALERGAVWDEDADIRRKWRLMPRG